jgi:hypothetical protein
MCATNLKRKNEANLMRKNEEVAPRTTPKRSNHEEVLQKLRNLFLEEDAEETKED